MHENMDMFSAACEDFGFTISTKKTDIMYQPVTAAPYIEPTIKMVQAKSLLWLASLLALTVLCHEQAPLMKRSLTEVHVPTWPLATTHQCVQMERHQLTYQTQGGQCSHPASLQDLEILKSPMLNS